METFTCEDCDKDFDHEDDGYMSEAGFECFDCYSVREAAAYAHYRAWKGSTAGRIATNYPTLAADVKRSEDDPAAFYHDCKNPGTGT